VTVHDAGEGGGVAFLSMELLGGCSLDEAIHDANGAGRRMPVAGRCARRGTSPVRPVCPRAGIVHRDVKPSNIRLVPDGRAILLDFGLAQNPDWDAHGDGTVPRHSYYAAPSKSIRRWAQSTSSPMFTRSATLYECVTGRAPFAGDSTRQIFHQILSKEATAPRRLLPEISRDLETVILKAMAKERERRYANASEFADDLDALLAMRPVKARPLHAAERLGRFVRRRPAVAVSAALALLLLVVVPWVFAVMRGRSLATILQLSDMVKVRELEQEAETLWPRRAEKVAAMEQWLTEARDMLPRMAMHRSRLEQFRAAGAPERGSQEVRWQISALTELLAELERLPASIEDVDARRTVALAVDRETVVEKKEAWQEAVFDIGVREGYGGLQIRPQPGLVPLGPDPESGLWEFLVWETGDAPERDPENGRFRVTDSTGIVLVLLPGGSTRIGSQDARPGEEYYDPASTPLEPLTEVRLDPFFLSKYEMTQGQWMRLMGTNPNDLFAMAGDTYASRILAKHVDSSRPLAHPVEYVTQQACADALARIGLELPTDAQWEYAARGGTTTIWWFGDDKGGLEEAGNISDLSSQALGSDFGGAKFEGWDDGYTFSAPVGHYAPNPFGLHDVQGNVWEWCRERFFSPCTLRPGDGERTLPEGVSLTTNAIARGGGYASSPKETRSAVSADLSREFAGARNGLRPARHLDVER
jgi:formylglycine-generating enzyme required for sulfatase activity